MSTATVAAAAALVFPSDAAAHWEADSNRTNPPLETVVQVDRLSYSSHDGALEDGWLNYESELLTVLTVTWGPGHEHEAQDVMFTSTHEFDGDETFAAIAAPKHVASHRECSPYSGEPTYTAKSFEVDEDSIIADYFGWTIGSGVGVVVGIGVGGLTIWSGPGAVVSGATAGTVAGAATAGFLGVALTEVFDWSNPNDAIPTYVNREWEFDGYPWGTLGYADVKVSSSVTTGFGNESSACASDVESPSHVIPGPSGLGEEGGGQGGGSGGQSGGDGDPGGGDDGSDHGSDGEQASILAPRPLGIDHLLRPETPMVTTSDAYFEEYALAYGNAEASAEDPVLQHNLANLAAFGFDEYHPISRNSCVSGQFYQQLFDSWAKAQARSPTHDGLTLGPTGDLARAGDILLAFGYAAAHRTWAEATARGFDAEVLADAQSAFQSAAWYALFGSIEQALDEYRWINTALTEAMYPEFQSVAACQGVLVDAGYVSAPEWTIVEPLEPVGPIGPLVPFESPGPFEPIDATWNGGFGLQSYEPLG